MSYRYVVAGGHYALLRRLFISFRLGPYQNARMSGGCFMMWRLLGIIMLRLVASEYGWAARAFNLAQLLCLSYDDGQLCE